MTPNDLPSKLTKPDDDPLGADPKRGDNDCPPHRFVLGPNGRFCDRCWLDPTSAQLKDTAEGMADIFVLVTELAVMVEGLRVRVSALEEDFGGPR